LIYIIVKSALP